VNHELDSYGPCTEVFIEEKTVKTTTET